MSNKSTSLLGGQLPTLVLLLIIAALALWHFLSGTAAPAAAGVPEIGFIRGGVLVLVGFAAGILGGLIGTGGCSVMLPIIHFWMNYPTSVAVGTTLFAVIFTAISGGYGHLVRRNLDVKVVAWLGGAGILGVILGSWLFTLIAAHGTKYLGLILEGRTRSTLVLRFFVTSA